MRKFHDAVIKQKDEVFIWGSGTPDEFLHVDDMAAASLYVLNLPKKSTMPTLPQCLAISMLAQVRYFYRELSHIVAKVTGYKGIISTDPSNPMELHKN